MRSLLRSETLVATLEELRKAGFVPTYEHGGKHIKIRAEGLPPITVSASASDCYAAKQARRTVRKIIAQNPLTTPR